MCEKIEAVIFDLDGTLIDSMWVWEKIDKVFLERFKITVPDDLDEKLEGKSFTETATYFKERFGLLESVEQIKQSFNAIAYGFYVNEVPLKKGAKEFLEFLKEHKIKMGIATSNSIELVSVVLDALQIKDYFQSVRTSCEVESGKPFPYIYLKVAKDLQIDPQKILVFEDIPNGILAAQRAMMEVWAIEDRQSEKTREKIEKMVEIFVKDYWEVLDRIKLIKKDSFL